MLSLSLRLTLGFEVPYPGWMRSRSNISGALPRNGTQKITAIEWGSFELRRSGFCTHLHEIGVACGMFTLRICPVDTAL